MTDSSPTVAAEEAEFFTFQEACRVLNVNERTLRKALDDGRLPFLELGQKTIRIPKDAVYAYKEAS